MVTKTPENTTPKTTILVTRTKNPGRGGKPTVDITEAGLKKITEMAANGNSDTTIAHTLGIAHLTFRGLRNNENKKVDAALQTGKGRLADEITDIILQKARDGNIIAAIFFAKGRLGWRESGPIPQAATTAVQVNIQVPARMTDEEFTKLVEVKTVTVTPTPLTE